MFYSRFFRLFTMALCVVALFATDADAARKKKSVKRSGGASTSAPASTDSRYAALIMNPVTGEVYHEVNADAQRYPASLTKMMTLYMLFEALEQKRTTMDAYLDVSEYAARMPQTNLSLDEGDSIPVEIAIKSLVVRSANDVSVVVAEALGGTVERFAQMMTAKARALGMNDTVFKNPNGLPNLAQRTTARDMAKLGIALKRDFPRYYPYFSTRQFSWNGVTYYTHNRVMLRYAGTDGIKTGFIGASGFNLVSSVTRGGRPMIGVVLGGQSGAWRDNRMIQLLDQSYKIVAKRGGTRGKIYADNLPISRNGKSRVGLISSVSAKSEIADVAPEVGTPEDDQIPAVKAAQAPTAVLVAKEDADVAPKVTAPELLRPATQVAKKAPSPFAAAGIPVAASKPVASKPAVAAVPAEWGIQVGAFSTPELALRAVNQSYEWAGSALAGARTAIAGPQASGAPIYRARLTNITERQAKNACEALIKNNSPCFIFKAVN